MGLDRVRKMDVPECDAAPRRFVGLQAAPGGRACSAGREAGGYFANVSVQGRTSLRFPTPLASSKTASTV